MRSWVNRRNFLLCLTYSGSDFLSPNYCEQNKTSFAVRNGATQGCPEWSNPRQPKRSMKFSVGLPQPAYAFVSDMSVQTNSSQSQARQAKHTPLVVILSTAHCTFPNMWSADNAERVIRPRTNQSSKCKISNTKINKKNTQSPFYDLVPPGPSNKSHSQCQIIPTSLPPPSVALLTRCYKSLEFHDKDMAAMLVN